MTSPKLIVGGGLAGLIAAHAWPAAEVHEANPIAPAHKALLRFRSDVVSTLTGIPFRPVTVRKGIWMGGVDGHFLPPSVRLANWYAGKVLGAVEGDRSIWSAGDPPATRYIAPDDFHERLVEQLGTRLHGRSVVSLSDVPRGTVTTAPLNVALEHLQRAELLCGAELKRAPISVARWRIPRCDVHQTIYFPEPGPSLYRASLTGSLLIIERAAPGIVGATDLELAAAAFGVSASGAEPLGASEQRYGKIAPLPDALRKQVLFALTHDHGLYSLGRFATWRNVLLDDVASDINTLRRMMAASAYELRKAAS